MQNKLALYRNNDLLSERDLGPRALEVGSDPSADLVVPDAAVPGRAMLVQEEGGTVWFYDLAQSKLQREVLGLDSPVRVSGPYHIVRRGEAHRAATLRRGSSATVRLSDLERPLRRWKVLVGAAGGGRCVTVGDRPLRIGKSRSNDLVLSDRTVSNHHCRLEPDGRSLVVRDLDSTNGTYLQGVQVARATLSAGARIRVGRTDLRVLAFADDGAPSSPFVAASTSMRATLSEAERFAELPWPVVILGPSGVGKEELAHLIHRQGARRAGPFVAVNAGGLPRELVESELFGHERGAFTGAVGKRRGVFEQAQGGTLFLDEIGELPLALQARLLRVLETWKVRPVGAESEVPVDVRLVCATHRDLPVMVAQGTFRQDLYYRLMHLVLPVSPLAERPEDVVALAEHFLRSMEGELGARSLSSEAQARLLAHDWPGNARELRNALCAAAAACPASELSRADVEAALRRLGGAPPLDPAGLARTVAHYGGNLAAASRALSMPRTTLRDRLRRSGLRGVGGDPEDDPA